MLIGRAASLLGTKKKKEGNSGYTALLRTYGVQRGKNRENVAGKWKQGCRSGLVQPFGGGWVDDSLDLRGIVSRRAPVETWT